MATSHKNIPRINDLTSALGFTASRGLFPLTLHTRLFVVLSTTSLRQDAVLLNLAIKAFQCSFKRLILADSDYRHQESPLSRPVLRKGLFIAGLFRLVRGPAKKL